jgi:hypothetical protein
MKKENKKKYTPLQKLKIKGKVIKAPLSELPVQLIKWDRDLVPEFLWIDALAQTYSKKPWANIFGELLDKIDARVTKDMPLLGLLSDFGRIPIDVRDSIINEHKDFIIYAFAEPIGRMLSLYPECPVLWLIPPDWYKHEKIDQEVELNKLEKSLLRLYNQNDDYCGYLRMMPLTRILKHGKLHFQKDMEIVKLLPKYPDHCTKDEKANVESFGRCIVNQFLLIGYKNGEISLKWPQYFWRRNFDLSQCSYEKTNLAAVEVEAEKQNFDNVANAANKNAELLIQYLNDVVSKKKIDLYNPNKDEVVLGLFSRFTRLCVIFFKTPELWSQDLSRILLRCLADTCITLCFLLKENDDQLFKDFIEYGKGQEKLLMLHLQDSHPNGIGPSGETVDQLASEIGGWIAPELIDINLSGWTKQSVRDMAEKCDLQKIYRLIYAPTSSDIHGSWTSIKNTNLTYCKNPLHRNHRIPQRMEVPLFLTPLITAAEMWFTLIKICEDNYSFPRFLGEIDDFKDKKTLNRSG